MWSALPSVRLDHLIVPGPVERGLYVAPGTTQLVPQVLEKLVSLLDAEAAPPVVPEYNSKLTYSQHRYWRRNSQIGQLIWVDSGNAFDPYRLTQEARKRGLDPMRILRAIKVGRPFTAFQFQQMLEKIPNPALWAHPTLPSGASEGFTLRSRSMAKEGQAMWWTPLVIISDLMGLFYDPDLSEDALMRAFRAFMIRLAFLRQRAIVLGLLIDRPAPKGREHLLPEILKMARHVLGEEVQVESKFRTALKQAIR